MTMTAFEETSTIERTFSDEVKVINLFPEQGQLSKFQHTGSVPYSGSGATAPRIDEEFSQIDEEYSYLSLPKGLKPFSLQTKLAQSIIRTHYSNDIISNIKWLEENHEINNPLSISYVNSILQLITEYSNNYFKDPFSSFLLALYDGLIHDNYFLSIEKDKYTRVRNIIETLNNQELDYKKIDKYILKLDEIGFNITPY